MNELVPIISLFGVFLTVAGGFVGTVYVTRAKAKQDEPFRLLEQYQAMVTTLRADLASAREELTTARKEAHGLRNEVMGLRRELDKARVEVKALRDHQQGGSATA